MMIDNTENSGLHLSPMAEFDAVWNELDIVVNRTEDGYELYDAAETLSVDGVFAEDRLLTRVHPAVFWLSSTALLTMDPAARVEFRAVFAN